MKDITIVVADTFSHLLSRTAIERTLNCLPCREVLVFSDRNIYPDGRWVKVDPITIKDYNHLMLKGLDKFVNTDHVLVIQYDGMAVNADLWNDNFLNYDYIGAPWPWHSSAGNIGNGGFSLRSRQLIKTLASDSIEILPGLNEDEHIGIHYRNFLSSLGMVYPSTELAASFSKEHYPGHGDTFGFHGPFNVPYYLEENETIDFIISNPAKHSESSIIMVAHCFLANKMNAAIEAIKIGKQQVPDFVERFNLWAIPELRKYCPEDTIDSILFLMDSL